MEDVVLPPGFRFHPTDEELITHYLSRKVADFGFSAKAMADVDLNKCEPWDLPAKASTGEKEWYFFSLRDRKYPTGLRTNRATEAGYWKMTGKDKDIFRQSGLLVGMKKTLVFYNGRAPKGEKSNWVMHEYRLENNHSIKPTKEEWVICRVFQKENIVKKPHCVPSDEQSPDSPSDANSLLHNQFGDIERMPNLIKDSTNVPLIRFANNISTQIQHLSPLNWLSLIGGPGPTLSPYSPLLTSNMSVNSLLLKALQLKSYHHQQLSSGNEYPFIPNTAILPNPQFEGENLGVLNFHALSPSSSSKVNLEEEKQPFSWTPFSEDM